MSNDYEYEASLSKYPWLLNNFKNTGIEKKISIKPQYEYFDKISKYVPEEWKYMVKRFSERKTIPNGFRIKENVLMYKNRRNIYTFAINDIIDKNSANRFIEFLELCKVSYEDSRDKNYVKYAKKYNNLSEIKSSKVCVILLEDYVCRKAKEYGFSDIILNKLYTLLLLLFYTKNLDTFSIRLEKNRIKNIDEIQFDYDMKTFTYKSHDDTYDYDNSYENTLSSSVDINTFNNDNSNSYSNTLTNNLTESLSYSVDVSL